MNESVPDRPSDQLTEADTDRKHGEHILGIFAEDAKRRQGADPLLEALIRAHRAKAEADRR
jgi:hypothetical protein